MKNNKLVAILGAVTMALGIFGANVEKTDLNVQAQEQKELAIKIENLQEELFVDESTQKAVSNVGDNQEYVYWITETKGEEVHGKPLNKISSTNGGIFLYQDEIGQNVEVGDKIVVVWGENEDEFKSIKVLKK